MHNSTLKEASQERYSKHCFLMWLTVPLLINKIKLTNLRIIVTTNNFIYFLELKKKLIGQQFCVVTKNLNMHICYSF